MRHSRLVGGDGDAAAVVEALVVAHYGRLVRAIVLSGVKVGVAEEAVQEAFARLWQTLRAGHEIRHPPAWLSTVAFNEVRSRWRRRRVEERALPVLVPLPGAADPVEHGEVRSALAGLARRQREAVVCFYFLDLSVKETAAVMDASEGMVKNALSRARAKLAAVLGEEVEVDGDCR